jgi:poly(3-hydroxybutyrate) depolymerase
MTVYYSRPRELAGDSQVIIVMHGMNRNARTYRDRWAEYAERHRFLVLAPEFHRDFYPANVNYYLAGMVEDEEQARFQEEEEWAYHQVERVFATVREELGLQTSRYGLYGHSAGAQFAHRLVLFHPESSADVTVSANAGWYTLPCLSTGFPYGLGDSPVCRNRLARALQRPLVVLLGDADRDPCHPNLRVTPEALEQGVHRLDRGRNFFDRAQAAAKQLGVPCRWTLKLVPGAAHRDRDMSGAALDYIL